MSYSTSNTTTICCTGVKAVTEDYCFPFCLLKCASYKGLKSHLLASQHLFNYEFWVDYDFQVVIVSAKATEPTSEFFGKMVDPREQSFFFCHKPKRRKSERQNRKANQGGQLVLDSSMRAALNGLRSSIKRVSSTACITASGPVSTSQPVPGSSSIPPTTPLQFAKTRKLSIE